MHWRCAASATCRRRKSKAGIPHVSEAARDALRRVRARHRQSLRRLALRRRGDQQQRPVGHPGDRPARRARQVRPLARVRRARHGPRGPSIILVSVRADHAHLSAATRYIGLGATVSTSFGEPYHVARTFGSIDHITKGRAAWNVVPSSAGKAALNFSREAHMEHDLRYEVAQEFVDVVKGLWDCWEDGAIVANKATGVYIDPSKVRPLDHRGRFFQVKGPVNMARCPQGHPVIIQAGGSEAGLELAARTADVVFSVVQELSGAKRAYRDLKGRMAKYGRTPDQITVLPGVMPIIGSTEAEARDKLSRLQSWLTPTNALTLVTSRIGYDVTGFPLDGPVPAPPSGASSQTFSRVLYETARRENMTLRDLYNLTAAARGHWVLCGTPKRIADTLEEWFVEEAADGFNVLPPYFPGALADFVDLVVPELQARGLFRREYECTTLRDHFR